MTAVDGCELHSSEFPSRIHVTGSCPLHFRCPKTLHATTCACKRLFNCALQVLRMLCRCFSIAVTRECNAWRYSFWFVARRLMPPITEHPCWPDCAMLLFSTRLDRFWSQILALNLRCQVCAFRSYCKTSYMVPWLITYHQACSYLIVLGFTLCLPAISADTQAGHRVILCLVGLACIGFQNQEAMPTQVLIMTFSQY